jgi:SagB-type dehydrogenase family enzyme
LTAFTVQYQRAPHLMVYWRDGRLRIENYVRREHTEAAPLVLEVLDCLSTWQTKAEVQARLPRIPAALFDQLFEALLGHGLVVGSNDESDGQKTQALESWTAWSPVASYFHLATKDVPFTPRAENIRRLRQRATETPPPSALKRSDARLKIALPPAPPLAISQHRNGKKKSKGKGPDSLPEVLAARRTWRRFGTRPLALDELGTLLGWTWAVQDWVEVKGWGRMALKTAPSGGSRHSVEAYVLARKVDGLEPGLYHYQPAAHELHLVRPKATAADIRAYLPEQGWYGAASALVLMTAVFPRVQWRYPFARAYRTVLAEVGHHCQNFCLVSTWLGLAPFCTMALADSRIEGDLGIDGVTESVLYAAGVGPRPDGVPWAPWPGTAKTPRRARNNLQQERRGGVR